MQDVRVSPQQRTRWSQVYLVLAIGVVAAFHNGKAPIALPLIRTDFGLGLEAVAWVLSAFPIVGGLAGAGLGVMIARLGVRATAVAGLFVLAAASAAGSLAPGLPVLLLTRIVEGFCLMAVSIAAPALLETISTLRDRPMAIAIWSTFMPLGMAVAMVAAPLLTELGWRGLWLLMAAAAVTVGVLAQRKLVAAAAPPVRAGSHLGRDLVQTLAAPGPRLLTAIFFTWAVQWAVLTGFLPTLLIERAGVGVGTAGLLTALVGAATIVGNLVAGPLLHRGVPRWLLLATASGVVALCGSVIFEPGVSPWLSYGACVVLTLVGGMIPSCLLGGAAAYAPERRLIAPSLGLIMQGSNLGLILGPAAAGAAVASLGWEGARLVVVPAALASLALSLRFRRLGPQSAPPR